MNDTFDSRALRLTDCYGQRFMRAGTYAYAVLPAGGHCVTRERPYRIKVVEAATARKMEQATVLVSTHRGQFRVPEGQAELTIQVGDLVLWHVTDPRAVPFMVAGDQDFFGSHRLVNESGYSHAFASPGEFHWADAYGSGVGGVIRVRQPRCRDGSDFEAWHRQLATGTVVMVTPDGPTPREVEIVTGQTVFFAVTKGPGISVTDQRLLAAGKAGAVRPEGHCSAR